eukprot:jgi/Tetstr1/437718/TSEL_026372.t1
MAACRIAAGAEVGAASTGSGCAGGGGGGGTGSGCTGAAGGGGAGSGCAVCPRPPGDSVRLALWPLYEGSGAAAREVCGWSSSATWAVSAGADLTPRLSMTYSLGTCLDGERDGLEDAFDCAGLARCLPCGPFMKVAL